MYLLFLIWWGLLLYFGLRSRNAFLFIFVVTQFVFVGLGLLVFPNVPRSFLENTFSDFNFITIDDKDFQKASLVVLTGVSFSVLFVLILRVQAKVVGSKVKRYYSRISTSGLLVCGLAAVIACGYFIVTNGLSFAYLLLADHSDELVAAFDMRQSAVSDYFIILLIYNFCPFVAAASLVWLLEKRRNKFQVCLVLFICVLTISSLLLTFQKRPILIFLIALLMCWKLHRYFYSGNSDLMKALYVLSCNTKKYFIFLFLALVGLYYLYTGYRIANLELIQTFSSLSFVAGSRIIGRLSIPAAFYVDFFPAVNEYYGLTNVGLLSRVLGFETFLDTSVVFSHYSYSIADGSVAASAFIDAYGQGGVYMIPFAGAFFGILIFVLGQLMRRAASGSDKLLFFIFGLIFIYYMSQASLFRSMLGYGGVIWFLLWFALGKERVLNENK